MAATIDLTLDCANPPALAAFWKLALEYQDEPPPAPFATREEWLQQYGGPRPAGSPRPAQPHSANLLATTS
jgi:hypothetical protein